MATHIDTFPHVPSQPSRRALLGGLAGAAAVTLAPVAAGAATDPHMAWEAELPALRAATEALADYEDDAGEAAHDAACDALWDMEKRIMTTPARSLPGVMAQLRVTHTHLAEHGTVSNDDEEVIALGYALATIEALAGRAQA